MKTLLRWLAGSSRRHPVATGNRARRAAVPLPTHAAANRPTIRELRVFGLPLRIPG